MNNRIGKPIGSGGTSDVYEWGSNEVIKIFKPHVTDDVINNEMEIGQLLNALLHHIPKFSGAVHYDGKKALVYERIQGLVMAHPLLQGRYEKELAQKFAQLHYDIHQLNINELPSLHDFLDHRLLELRGTLGEQTASLLDLLHRIPRENKLCHGDFQPFNVIGERGNYAVIDWNGACSGNPVLDVAWSYLTLNSPIVQTLLGEPTAALVGDFAKDYLTCYCKLSGIREEDIMEAMPIVAARRLFDHLTSNNENDKHEKEWLLDLIHSHGTNTTLQRLKGLSKKSTALTDTEVR